MKIGIVTEYYYPTLGGIQEHVHHFATAACRSGHDVRIITPEVRDDFASVHDSRRSVGRDGQQGREYEVIRMGLSMPIFSGGSIARASTGRHLSRRIADLLRSERFDVLHLHSPLMPTLPLLSLQYSDSLNVGTFHSAIDRSLLYATLRPVFQRYADRLDAAIGVSDTALVGVRRYFRAPWHVIPNGVDASLFSSGKRRPELDDGRPNVLHVGRFDPRNGVDRVVNAWIGVRRAGLDARLILVGDGPLRREYEAMIPRDLRRDALFVGFVPSAERIGYYASGDVLLCPAVGGTFGIILVEAMAAGCAIVAADTPGFRHVMTDGVQGFMVDIARDPDSTTLAERTSRLLTDATLRRRCVEAGRQTAAQFDWPIVSRQILSLYQRLLGNRAESVSTGTP